MLLRRSAGTRHMNLAETLQLGAIALRPILQVAEVEAELWLGALLGVGFEVNYQVFLIEVGLI